MLPDYDLANRWQTSSSSCRSAVDPSWHLF